jgi:hypothetical protein
MFTHFFVSKIMTIRSLSSVQWNIILTMPVAGQFTYSPASTTDIHHSAISLLHPKEHSEL